MRRREFVSLLGGVAAALPLTAYAQQAAMPVIGFIRTNVTGISTFGGPLGAKRLGLLHELLPTATKISLLVYPDDAASMTEESDVLAAAGTLGVQVHVVNTRTENEIDAAFADFAQQRIQAVIVGANAFFASRRMQIIELSARQTLPVMYGNPAYVAAGGLVSYSTSITGVYSQAGVYAGRILKGEMPADLPVQLPTTFELTINLKTAKSLGLEVPPALLARADEVIE
jgi:putative tryptophan/tyrosine transport system substrate-binding protein